MIVSKGKKVVNTLSFYRMKTDEISGELYFVKFIINLEEDDSKPEVILGRSFLRLAHGVVDFGNGVITFYPELDPFEDDSKKTGNSSDDWDQLLYFNFDDFLSLVKNFLHLYARYGRETITKREHWRTLIYCIKILDHLHQLEEKDNPDAFIFLIRLEGKVNENALADTGLDINTMSYLIYETLGREEMKQIDRGITMINHTYAKAMRKLSNVLC
nr:hypothetical protein [Tanacetum cinerariifolium]